MQSTIKNVSIIGAGSWGTSIARVMALKDTSISITVWAHEKHVAASINNSHINNEYLPGVVLPENINATNNLKEAVRGSQVILLATPSKVIYDIAIRLARNIDDNCHIGFLSKGFCKINNNIYTISQALAHAIPSHKNRITVISGPSHAEEVSHNYHTCLSVAGKDNVSRSVFSSLLTSDYVQCRELEDIIGVELGGTLKNPAAIAAGMISILPGCGDNLAGALISEAQKEIIRLGSLFNVKPETLIDISGLGDLVATALSDNSRNRRFGKDIAGQILKQRSSLKIYEKILLKLKPEQIIHRMSEKLNYLAEGAYAIEPLIELAQKSNISIPVYRSLYEVLLNKKDPAIFDELYRNAKIQITQRQKGLETLSGKAFKNVIIDNLRDSEFLIINKDDNEIIESISELKTYAESNSQNMSSYEKSLITNLSVKNFSKSVLILSRMYINEIIDGYNNNIRKISLKLFSLFSLLKLNTSININGSYKKIHDLHTSANIIYLPLFEKKNNYIELLLVITRLGLPYPRFSVSKSQVQNTLKKYFIKKLGGFIVNKSSLKNKIYRETLYHYLVMLLKHGVPFLYSFKKIYLNSTDNQRDELFSILLETIIKHSVEIVLVPITCNYQKSNNLQIHFSEPLQLSEYLIGEHKGKDIASIIEEILIKEKK